MDHVLQLAHPIRQQSLDLIAESNGQSGIYCPSQGLKDPLLVKRKEEKDVPCASTPIIRDTLKTSTTVSPGSKLLRTLRFLSSSTLEGSSGSTTSKSKSSVPLCGSPSPSSTSISIGVSIDF